MLLGHVWVGIPGFRGREARWGYCYATERLVTPGFVRLAGRGCWWHWGFGLLQCQCRGPLRGDWVGGGREAGWGYCYATERLVTPGFVRLAGRCWWVALGFCSSSVPGLWPLRGEWVGG